MMRSLPCAVYDWVAPYGTPAPLAAWWLTVGVLCGVVAWLVVWRDDE